MRRPLFIYFIHRWNHRMKNHQNDQIVHHIEKRKYSDGAHTQNQMKARNTQEKKNGTNAERQKHQSLSLSPQK